ncbi:MAG: flavin reductase family protein, partial [Brevinematales bacterium]
PVVVVGAEVNKKPTFTTIAWCTPVEDEPPLVLSAIAKNHYILLKRENLQVYSLNFPSEDQLREVDYCGMVSGYECDKSSVFRVEYGKYKAPLIADAPISLECQVRQWIDIGESCWLLVGEVVESYIFDEYIQEGKVDISQMKIVSYLMRLGEYRSLGKKIARARHIGRELCKE